MININIQTLLIHMTFFVVVVIILNRMLFQPLLRVMEERESKVEGNRKLAQELAAKAEEMKMDYLQKLEAARKEAGKELESIRRTAEEEREKMLIQAREKAGGLIADLRERIAAEFSEAQAGLKQEAENMGKAIAARILGRDLN